jgi:hypothetical protein
MYTYGFFTTENSLDFAQLLPFWNTFCPCQSCCLIDDADDAGNADVSNAPSQARDYAHMCIVTTAPKWCSVDIAVNDADADDAGDVDIAVNVSAPDYSVCLLGRY